MDDSTPPYTIDDLLWLMRRLRDPLHGCPWDLEQTFASIVPHTLEECYELADCIERGDSKGLSEELGDLLFQVVFYARLGEEQRGFDFNTVVDQLVRKLLRRHPHVFPTGSLSAADETDAGDSGADVASVHRQWETIKAAEREGRAQPSAMDDIPLNLPALSRAAKLQRRAARVGFDWSDAGPVRSKLVEELIELEQAQAEGDPAAVAEEVGDLLFSCVNLARHLGVDPETALRHSGHKFERRFRYIEQCLQTDGRDPGQVELVVMDRLWDAAKRAGL